MYRGVVYPPPPPEFLWIKRIRKGDVLRSRSGKLRTVRNVVHGNKTGTLSDTSVIFTIAHCSWTHRCYTVYSGNDLKHMGYRPTRAKVNLSRAIDKRIEKDFHAKHPALSCCDVEGVA